MSVVRMLIATDAVGGVWTYTIELARALALQGVQPVVAAMGPRPTDEQFAMAGNIAVIDTGLPLDWLAEHPREVREAGQRLAELADDTGADLVQLHSGAFACNVSFKQPVVVVQHSCVASWWDSVRGGSLPAQFEWQCDMNAGGLNRADAVVAPTVAFAEQITRIYNLWKPVTVVHNGRTAPPPPEGPQVETVLTVGRLWDQGKNVRTLDAAAALLAARFEAIGPLKQEHVGAVAVRHLIASGAASEQAIAEHLAARPIFASAALYEPFGLSVLEAALAGCPLVLSDIPTFRELWADAAVFVPAMDEQRFADAIATLLNNPELRTAYGRAARTRAEQYAPAAMATEMLQVYQGLLQGRRTAMQVASAA
ncbi:MAG TPA: glycosyltransferase family 4 protein [Sphingomicrobium sp.]|nr:glycosyltransferase family 4 protein [Sphingomicrobium sp.]